MGRAQTEIFDLPKIHHGGEQPTNDGGSDRGSGTATGCILPLALCPPRPSPPHSAQPTLLHSLLRPEAREVDHTPKHADQAFVFRQRHQMEDPAYPKQRGVPSAESRNPLGSLLSFDGRSCIGRGGRPWMTETAWSCARPLSDNSSTDSFLSCVVSITRYGNKHLAIARGMHHENVAFSREDHDEQCTAKNPSIVGRYVANVRSHRTR